MITDPLTEVIRNFFRSQVLQPSSRISFDDLPVSVSDDAATDKGSYSQTRANEYFSRFVADSLAIIDGGIRQNRQGSFGDEISYSVVSQAVFLVNPEKSKTAQDRDHSTFDKLLAEARRRLHPLAVAGPVPQGYLLSNANPSDWLNPESNELWQSYTQVLEGKRTEGTKGSTPPPLWPVAEAWPPKVPIFTRTIDPEALKRLLEGPKPGKPVPGWVDPLPDTVIDEPANVVRPGLDVLGGLTASGLTQRIAFDRSPNWSLHLLAADQTHELDATNYVLAQSWAAGAPLRARPGAIPLGFSETSADRDTRPPTSIDVNGITLADLNPAESHLTPDQIGVIKTSVLFDGIAMTEVAQKDRVDISFEYQIVSITRPWLFLPFLEFSQWFIPAVSRGQLSRGQEGPVWDVIPSSIIVVRNVSIKASFDDVEANALGRSAMIGPFALGEHATVVNGELRITGTQIIGYVDEPLPVIPPRSDPGLAT